MADLKLGSTGPEVAALQERLRELGFDPPGRFGPVTDLAVRRFQERTGLLPDGIVGPRTREVLERIAAGEPLLDERPGGPPGPPVDRSLRLPLDQIVAERHPKDLVVLHHTVGASARSTFLYWRDSPARIATAYIVERDGTIHEVFDPALWAYHLGVVGNENRIDRRSIGIEIASEGALVRSGNRFYAFGDATAGTRYTGPVFTVEPPWRGVERFAAYTAAQVGSAIALVDHLCDVFAIPRRTPADATTFDPAHVGFLGVIGHHHVRRDKTDLHPGFPWDDLVTRARLERV